MLGALWLQAEVHTLLYNIQIMKVTFQKALTPGSMTAFRARWGVLVMLALSMTALLMAPMLMPGGYSWLIHTTSESAAQGLAGAWLARLGFLLFGLAVLWLASASDHTWSRAAVWMHIGFGVMMVATAAFSHRPFLPGVPFDPVEDWLHSFTATLMGFAFSFGVFFRFLQRENSAMRILDLAALASAIFIPLLMMNFPGITGLVQRLMFLVAYLWYGTEAWQLGKRIKSVHSG